jgi:AcrR family transcriptional regulator
LDAGVSVLEESGYKGFTIAAVCEKAQVSVATIYARVAGKDALFFAVYEHALARIDRESTGFDPRGQRDIEAVVRKSVAVVADKFINYEPFMKAVILLSGEDKEVRRRGSAWTTNLGELFGDSILSRREDLLCDDPDFAVDLSYRTVLSAVIIHVAYGPDFQSKRPLSDEMLIRGLQDLVVGLLLPS